MIAAAPGNRTLAFCRILTGVLFAAEGYAKLTGPFVRGGFAAAAAEAVKGAYPFWRPVLRSLVAPHAGAFAWAIALGEALLGVALLLGFLVRAASAAGIALVLAIGLSTAVPGPGSPWAAWITSWLTPGACILLLLIFAVSDAGKRWGIDARRR